MKIIRVRLKNFLSFREATLEFDGLAALVGPNAAGKSNAVSALKLLHEIPLHGLPLAIARRGGFDQLRHRSRGRPFDPAVGLDFETEPGAGESHYDLVLGALPGGRYEVKREAAVVRGPAESMSFGHRKGRFEAKDPFSDASLSYDLPPGTSAITSAPSFGAYLVRSAIESIRTVAINPVRVAELQEPSSTTDFETDGSNAASFFEQMTPPLRQRIVDELAVIVPSVQKVEPRRLADKYTLAFYQRASGQLREFLAKQMSDGTLRAFGQLVALHAPASERVPAVTLVVIEEPEIAIHLGALRALMELFVAHAETTQILITTHSAELVDVLAVDQLRVVWNQDGASHISRVADHTKEIVRNGLMSTGDLLRSDALDPAVA